MGGDADRVFSNSKLAFETAVFRVEGCRFALAKIACFLSEQSNEAFVSAG